MHKKCDAKSSKEKNDLGDLGVQGRVILGYEGVDWIKLAQNRFQSRAVVNTTWRILNARISLRDI
jgi:hypothetical protein